MKAALNDRPSRSTSSTYRSIAEVLQRSWAARSTLTSPAEQATAEVPSFTYNR